MGAEGERWFVGRSLLLASSDSTKKGYGIGPRYNEAKVSKTSSLPSGPYQVRPNT